MTFNEVIREAINNNNSRVEISYKSYNHGNSVRQLSNVAYSNEFGSGHNYISAFCHLRNEKRTFKLNRIEKIRLVTNSRASDWVSNPSFYSKKSGCYIATMAYGDHEHPQVIILRQFRDDILLNNSLGKMFVKLYYFISPRIVFFLKDNESINRFIRKILDKLIEGRLKPLN